MMRRADRRRCEIRGDRIRALCGQSLTGTLAKEEDRTAAREVGRRTADRPVVLEVRAREANRAGVSFFRGSETMWLAEAVPPGVLGSA